MRELTMYELDGELAEQLPARELMGGCYHRSGSYSETNIAAAGNNNGSGSLYLLSGNQVQVLTFGSSNGNAASAG